MPCCRCGRCCITYLVDLTEEEVASGLYEWEEDINEFAPGILKRVWDEDTGKDQCIYLKRGTYCAIYERRPEACREFLCVRGETS
jgi:Fe-S-cluster containining protein